MKNMIRKWKSIFPIIDLKLIQTTDSKLNYLVNYYSKDVKNLQIQFNKLTNHGYHILSLFNLQELNIDNCSGDGIQIISNSLKNLSKLVRGYVKSDLKSIIHPTLKGHFDQTFLQEQTVICA
jgi:hypothetical protein